MKVNNVLEVIGNTPLVKLNKIFGSDVEVFSTHYLQAHLFWCKQQMGAV